MFVAFASANERRVEALASKWRRESAGQGVVWSEGQFVMRCTDRTADAIHMSDRLIVAAHGRFAIGDEDGAPIVDLSELASRLATGGDGDSKTMWSSLVGAYALIVWDRSRGVLSAVRDYLGTQGLYYRADEDGIYVSDEPSHYDEPHQFDLEFISSFIAAGGTSVDRTIWKDTRPVPAGSFVTWESGKIRAVRYWSASAFAQDLDIDPEEAGREFRRLATAAVQFHMEPERRTWTDLSGGLDSSSVASLAALNGERDRRWLPGGAITFAYSIDSVDESDFARAVAVRLGLRQEFVSDYWAWKSDGVEPPRTPHPSRDLPYYRRDIAVAELLANNGADTLLSGVGPDVYLPFTASHVPDLFAAGRFTEGGKQLFDWAVARRVSIWNAALKDVIVPMAPVAVQSRYAAREVVPDWLRKDFVKATAFVRRTARSVSDARAGRLYAASVDRNLERFSASIPSWRSIGGVSVRHPLLHKPLVEFCLRLPYALRTDSFYPKPLLRSAMTGVLPDLVVKRATKGSFLAPHISFAFRQERAKLVRLLQSSVLADLGCIEPGALSAAIDGHVSGASSHLGFLYTALSLETWFSINSSRRGVW